MVLLPEIFLGYLKFGGQGSALQPSEYGAERLPRLEVNRSVLDLDHHVGKEFPVKGFEFLQGLHRAVSGGGGVDEGTPHDYPAFGGEDRGEHVRSVSMGPPEILRTGLTFAACLHEESSEIRYK